MSVMYRCDGCIAEHAGIGLPSGWTKARGFIAPEDRAPRQGARPVVHFCSSCTAKRDDARKTLGRKRLRVT